MLDIANRNNILKCILLSLVFTTLNLISKDYTPYYINFGIGANFNTYQSDFAQLKGYPNCCSKFDNAFGLSYYLYAGLSKHIDFINDKTKIGVDLELNNLSAKYSVNEYIGNDIVGSNYRKIYVDHNLDVDWLVAGINPYLNFKLFENLPLELKVGLNLGVPIAKSFTQQEVLVEPSDLNFSNGTKINNNYAGDLPDASPIYAGALLGANYKVANISGFEFLPEISILYGLSSPVKNYNWNNITVKAGISIAYNIPQKSEERIEVVPTIEPQLPAPPEPPNAPIVTIKVMDNNKVYQNNDTLTAVYKVDYYNYMLSYLPILFYNQNETTPISSMRIIDGTNDMNFFEIIRKSNFADNYPDIVSEYAIKNNLKIEIIAQSPDDKNEILNDRINIIKNNLISKGVLPDNIKISIANNTKIKDKRPQLIDESRKITFKFSNKAELISSTIVKDKINFDFNKSLAYLPSVKSEFARVNFDSYTQFNKGAKNKVEYKLNDILLSASLFESSNNSANKFKIYAEAVDSLGQKGTDEFVLYLNSKKEINNKYYNITDNDNSALILGYFNFDSYNFSAIDYNVLNYIKDKINDNSYQIEIVPSTDNLGTLEYNKSLAEKRAKSTLNLLAIKSIQSAKNIIITFPENELFNNETPYGRYLNRTVVVKIKKK